MVFNKLSGMATVLGQDAGVLASILTQAMKSKGNTCIIEYLGEEGYSLVVTCLNADNSNNNWRWNEYFSFDFFKGTDRLHTIDCGVDLADLNADEFKECYLRIGGTDWEALKNEDDAKKLMCLQAF